MQTEIDPTVEIKHDIIIRFLHRTQIRMRSKQKNKKKPIKFHNSWSGMPHLEKNVFGLALINQVILLNGDNANLLKGLMLIRVNCLLMFKAKRLTNIFHLVKALHIIHGFLNHEQNVIAPYK